jgi:hypothetical protein
VRAGPVPSPAVSSLGDDFPAPGRLDRWVGADRVAQVLGGPAEVVTPLTHNPLNAVTGGIWRVDAAGRSAVVKVLTDGAAHDGPSWWSASSDDPTHWNWWRREACAYGEDLAGWFRPDGIDAPPLLALDEREDGGVVLWLGWVDGQPGPDVGVAGLADMAGRLGRAQARLAAAGPDMGGRAVTAGSDMGGRAVTAGSDGWVVQDTPWLTRGFLDRYSASKPVDEARLDDDRAWAHPRVVAHLGHLREPLRRLHHDRRRYVDLAARCPRTLSHLDLWPANLARRDDGSFVLFDWSFCGDGAVGEDVANLIPDAVLDLFLPIDTLDEIAESVETAYLAGLRAGGWREDERWARLGIRAAAVKYHWLVDGLLAEPDRAERMVYGGRSVAADDLYHVRATGLALLCRWADEADALAADLGLTPP